MKRPEKHDNFGYRDYEIMSRYGFAIDPPVDGGIRPIRSKTQPIPLELRSPMYTDERFARATGGLTIFLAHGLTAIEDGGMPAVKGAFYNYDDRIEAGFEYAKVEAARKDAQAAVGNNTTAAYYEAMLQRVYDDPTTQLQHIVAGVNAYQYPFQVYGTISDAK